MNESIRTHRFPLTTVSALAACALALTACSTTQETGDSNSASFTTEASTMAATSGSTSMSDSVSQTAAADSKTASPAAEAGAAPQGDANVEMKTLRPEPSAELAPTGVRIGLHEGYERVVFDLEGTGTPGWFIDYTDSPAQQGSGHAVEFNGSTALNVNIDGTLYPFELGIDAPNIGTVPGHGGIVTEVISLGTFEGRSQFVIGLDSRHPYSVKVLEDPTRLVIDIYTR